METLEMICIGLVGVTAIVLQEKKAFKYIGIINLLLVCVITFFLKGTIGEEDHYQLYAILSIVGVNYIGAQWSVLQKPGIRIILPLFSFIGFFLLFNGESVTVLGDEYSLVNKFIVAGTVLSILAYEFGTIKKSSINAIFKGMEHAEVIRSVMLLFIGFSLFFGGFSSGAFGIFIVASAFISSSFYRTDNSTSTGVTMLTFAVIPGLLSLTGGTEVNLLNSDVIEGLFIGVFGVYFLNQVWAGTNKFILIAMYVIILGFSFGLLFLETVYSQMGGMDAFSGVLVGSAITTALIGREYISQSLFTLLLIGGILLPSMMANEAMMEFEEKIESKATDVVSIADQQVVLLDLKEFKGKYTLDPDKSTVLFNLGKKGETKGAFKVVTGDVFFSEDLSKSTFSIELLMENFTTFNAFRDESLMGDEYFKADKFPKMNYKGKTIVDQGNDIYEIQGEFTMLGVTKPVSVGLSRIDKDGKKVISGNGEIDRRDFGMAPSATEGNVVSFEYEVELK